MIAPLSFPALASIRPPEGYSREPSWMVTYGWIELRSPTRPGWRVIVENWFDIECIVREGAPSTLYLALQRGPSDGERAPLIASYWLAHGASAGVITYLRTPERKGSRIR